MRSREAIATSAARPSAVSTGSETGTAEAWMEVSSRGWVVSNWTTTASGSRRMASIAVTAAAASIPARTPSGSSARTSTSPRPVSPSPGIADSTRNVAPGNSRESEPIQTAGGSVTASPAWAITRGVDPWPPKPHASTPPERRSVPGPDVLGERADVVVPSRWEPAVPP